MKYTESDAERVFGQALLAGTVLDLEGKAVLLSAVHGGRPTAFVFLRHYG